MSNIKTIVVDDETANRSLIRKLIKELHQNFEVIGEAADIDEAEKLIVNLKPELVFLDIKMPGGTGFDLLERFDELNFEVVFITGFDSYAIKAFEFNALDYIMKPINPIKFQKALSKIHSRLIGIQARPQIKEIIRSYDQSRSFLSRIALHAGTKVVFANIADIILVQSEDRSVSFKLKNGERYTSSKELADFAFILDNSDYMVRVSKGAYVNINYVKGYTKGDPCILLMENDISLEIPRRKKAEVLNLIFKS